MKKHLKIHVYAPDIIPNDAVGNHCLGVASIFKKIGFNVSVYARNFPQDHPQIQPVEALLSSFSKKDYLYVSFSIFDPVLEKLLELPGRKICYMHGITDPNLLKEYEPETSVLCQKGLKQLHYFYNFDKIICNSLFIAKDLIPFVKQVPIVIPPIFSSFPVFQTKANLISAQRSPKTVLLVGRIVPHKKIEDAITLLRKIYDKGLKYNLRIVGAIQNDRYAKFISERSQALGLSQYISFEGQVDEKKLFNFYQESHAYLSMSLHEGFCVPALEAMHFGLPVFVREGTAAEETVGNGGVILRNTLEDQANKLIDILESPTKTTSLINKGLKRKTELLNATSDDVWINIINDLPQ